MEAAERELFVRGVRRAARASNTDALEAALHELGWRDALAADPRTAVSVLFECQGAANVTSSALDVLLAAAIAPDHADAVVVLPPLRQGGTPGHFRGDRCHIEGLGTAALARSETAIVVIGHGEGATAVAVATRLLERRPVHGIDPALGLMEVSGDVPAASVPGGEPVDLAAALMLGRLALGHELVGAERAMLELARAHALERVQFGRPIGTFQAIRHRLADSFVAVEAAAALLDAAWDEPSPVTAGMAKAFAGRSARTVARHCQQVLAGIGFTTEHPLHRFVRRTLVLDQLLAAGSVLTHQLGTDILESGSLPPAFPL
jgi:alkylation response protein AidB-like acyl-CoA dehydrogenase